LLLISLEATQYKRSENKKDKKRKEQINVVKSERDVSIFLY
jgi:hypothetical protein